MQTISQCSLETIPVKGGDSREITITIAYDEKKAGERAAQLCSIIGREQEDELNIAIQPWRFDFLADPDWQRFAAAEALQADILVIAMTNPANLSAAVEHWFTKWLDGKRGFHAAVIVLVGKHLEANAPDSPELKFLESATREAGLDFFTPRADYATHPWTAPPLPPQAFSFGRPYRHWGINE